MKKRYAQIVGNSGYKGQICEIVKQWGNIYYLQVNISTNRKPKYQIIPYTESMVREVENAQ